MQGPLLVNGVSLLHMCVLQAFDRERGDQGNDRSDQGSEWGERVAHPCRTKPDGCQVPYAGFDRERGDQDTFIKLGSCFWPQKLVAAGTRAMCLSNSSGNTCNL